MCLSLISPESREQGKGFKLRRVCNSSGHEEGRRESQYVKVLSYWPLLCSAGGPALRNSSLRLYVHSVKPVSPGVRSGKILPTSPHIPLVKMSPSAGPCHMTWCPAACVPWCHACVRAIDRSQDSQSQSWSQTGEAERTC